MNRHPDPRDSHALRPAAPDPADTGLAALAWAVASGSTSALVQRMEFRRRRRQRRRLLITAGTATACLTLAGFWLQGPAVVPAEQAPVLASNPPGPRGPETRMLGDGSTVELRPGARMSVDYTPTARRIVLQTGEAHFAVRHDPARPFIVTAAGVEVCAVGTAFSVDRSRQAVAVLVTEGRVAVSSPPTAPAAASSSETPVAPLAMVDAGFLAIVPLSSHAATIEPVSVEESKRRLAWRVPVLEFTGTPLAEVLPLLNRYADRRLTCDPADQGRLLSGTLQANDLDSLLLLLRDEFDLQATPQADGSLRLHRRH